MDDFDVMQDEDSDGSDGDDLLVAPSTFLGSSKSSPGVRTPQKGIKPDNCNSPLTESKATTEPHKPTFSKKYSLSKLLLEKKRQKGKFDFLPDLKQMLEGGVLGLIDTESKDISDSQLNLSQELGESYAAEIAPELKPKMDKLFDSVKNDFPDSFPGECLMCNMPVEKVDPPPNEFLSEIEMEDLQTEEYADFIEEWVQSKAIADIAFLKGIGNCVMDWILKCMCHSSSLIVANSACEVLLAIVTCEYKASREPHWVPSLELFIQLLTDIGVSLPKNLSNDAQCDYEVGDDGVQNNKLMKLTLLTLHKLQYIIRTYSACLNCYPNGFSKDDIRKFILVSAALALDPRLIFISWDIQVLVGNAFACFKDEDWTNEVINLCLKYAQLTSHHRNYVRLADCIPPTERGLRFQHTLSLYLLSQLLEDGFVIPQAVLEDSVQNDKLGILLQICCKLSIHDHVDYYLLNSTVSLINLALPTAGYVVSQKKSLQGMIMKFRSLNGSIRDPRGAFMNRTKVKDLIVRTITRLNYFCQGLESQCHLEDYFEKPVDSQNVAFEEELNDKDYAPMDIEIDTAASDEEPAKQMELYLDSDSSSRDISSENGT